MKTFLFPFLRLLSSSYSQWMNQLRGKLPSSKWNHVTCGLDSLLTHEKDPELHGKFSDYTLFKKCLSDITSCTQNPFDVEIVGAGFFELLIDEEECAYSREGSFYRSKKGELVCTLSQCALNTEFLIPENATHIKIHQDGKVFAWVEDLEQRMMLGQIKLATFSNPVGLSYLDKGLFYPTRQSGSPQIGTPCQRGMGFLKQGFKRVRVLDNFKNFESQRIA